jgi:steroid delta-isomerase-like uncharacterized protein
MATTAETGLRERREAIVREHVETENRHQPAATLRTFERPRYELIATDEVIDGSEAVGAMYEETYTAFPDFHATPLHFHHADDAVIMEAAISATHKGPYRGLPPTGRRIELRGCAVFVFEDDRLVCERVYGDAASLLRQLGVARDPQSIAGKLEMVIAHPLRIGRALLRGRRRQAKGDFSAE